MIYESETNAIQPPDPTQQVLLDVLVREEIHHRFKLDTKRLDGDHMAESLDPAGGGRKDLRLARLDLDVQQVSIFAHKDTVAGSGIDISDQMGGLAAAPQDYR